MFYDRKNYSENLIFKTNNIRLKTLVNFKICKFILFANSQRGTRRLELLNRAEAPLHTTSNVRGD